MNKTPLKNSDRLAMVDDVRAEEISTRLSFCHYMCGCSRILIDFCIATCVQPHLNSLLQAITESRVHVSSAMTDKE